MSIDFQYASPKTVSNKEECIFYHSFDYPNGDSVEGDWDMRGAFEAYTGNVNFQNKRFLDIGTASGFLSFEAEKRGAEVVSFDADSTARYCRLPFKDDPFKKDPALAISQDNQWLDRVKNSYWYSHKAFNSNNKVFYGNVYDLPEELGMFDIVIVGQFLVHNRSAIDILESVASKAADIFIITEGMIESDTPSARFLGRAANPDNRFSNWLYSPSFYNEVMGMMGFSLLSQTKGKFKCNHQGYPSFVELVTLVFQKTV